MIDQGMLIVFSGPSGVGKDTVLKRLLQLESGCVLSVSATTRTPRAHEIDGQDYHFITRERFGELVARGEMLEYASYNDNLYGTPKAAVDEQLAKGHNVILEIEVNGAMAIKKLRPDAVFVFLMPPGWHCLETRLLSRGTETDDSVAKRLALAKYELSFASQYDYILINDDIEKCCQDFLAVITATRHSVRHMADFLQEVFLNAQTINVSNNQQA